MCACACVPHERLQVRAAIGGNSFWKKHTHTRARDNLHEDLFNFVNARKKLSSAEAMALFTSVRR